MGYIEYKARENGKQVEIDLPQPFGTVKITAVRQRANQSPVVKADVEIDGKFFQVRCLGYQDGSWSNYLGNCYSQKADSGIWF